MLNGSLYIKESDMNLGFSREGVKKAISLVTINAA